MQLARQRLRAEREATEAKRRAKAALVHKQWVKQKRAEEATRREKECARLEAEKKAEHEVFVVNSLYVLSQDSAICMYCNHMH